MLNKKPFKLVAGLANKTARIGSGGPWRKYRAGPHGQGRLTAAQRAWRLSNVAAPRQARRQNLTTGRP